jgi:hypothetical protein
VAEEFLVEDPVCVLLADVDVHHRTGEKPRGMLTNALGCAALHSDM